MFLQKTISAVAGAAALAFTVLSAPTQAVQNPDEVKILFSAPTLANPWYMGVKSGVDAACKELGIKCETLDAQSNREKQRYDLKNKLLQHDYDAVLASAVDPLQLRPIYNYAQKKGIITGSLAQTIPHSDLIYTLDEQSYGFTIGLQAAHWAQKNLKCRGKVAVLTQDDNPAIKARGNGVVEALHEVCPELEIVARYPADDTFSGMTILDLLLPRYPDLNLVVSTTDSGGIGGYIIMHANQMGGDKFAVFSGDATRDALLLMQEPDSIYRGSVDLNPYRCGYESIMAMYDMIQNGAPEEPKVETFPYVQVSQKMVLSGVFNATY